MLLYNSKIIILRALTNRALNKAHGPSHPGANTLKRRIQTTFWFPQLATLCEEKVRRCKNCAMLPDQRHILVAQDVKSKFLAAKIMNKTNAGSTTKALKDIYTAYRTPNTHRMDNGPPFNSEGFKQFPEEMGIKHKLAFPWHPQSNRVSR